MTTEELMERGEKAFGERFAGVATWIANQLVEKVRCGNETLDILDELNEKFYNMELDEMFYKD